MLKLLKIFTLFNVVFGSLLLSATSIRLTADKSSAGVGEQISVTLTIQQDSKQGLKEIKEPAFSGFEIDNRGESSSTSMNIINGKVSYRKEKHIQYILRPMKEGTFTLGPAKALLESGKKISSNSINVVIVGGAVQGATPNQPQNQQGTIDEEESQSDITAVQNNLFAPLTAWEKKTKHYFLRILTEPTGNVYRGEPVVVSYYLFTRKNAISDLNFYEMPTFENVWKEEVSSPRQLSFKRVNIGGTVYDYALLKKYLLIPEKHQESIRGTQMIVDIITGGFFNARKKSLSSPALNIPMSQMPEHPEMDRALYGDLTISQTENTIRLTSNKLLDTITFTLRGCGNIPAAELKIQDVRGLKIFSPDVKQNVSVKNSKLCGSKTFKFMVKGKREGTYTIDPVSLSLFDREKEYYTISTKPVTVEVSAVSKPSEHTADNQKKQIEYEYLKELPQDLKVYNLEPITNRKWFKILLILPFILLFLSLFVRVYKTVSKKRERAGSYKMKQWEARLKKSKDASDLMNLFFDAMADVYDIHLKGEREKDIERKYGTVAEPLNKFVKYLQYAIYSSGQNSNVADLQKKAIDLFKKTGKMV